jgi:hypothetical protein
LRSATTLAKTKTYRNRMVMELRGNIEVREPLKEGRKKETRSAPIEAQSTLDFEERIFAARYRWLVADFAPLLPRSESGKHSCQCGEQFTVI